MTQKCGNRWCDDYSEKHEGNCGDGSVTSVIDCDGFEPDLDEGE